MKKYLLICFIFILLFLGACSKQTVYESHSNLERTEVLLTGGDEIKKFTSDYDLKEFIKNNQINIENGVYGDVKTISLEENVRSSTDSTSNSKNSNVYAQDFSQTNNQVKNVDEGDIVKNDGKYIYYILQDKLVILNGFPANDAQIYSETKIEGTPTELFIQGDRLILFSNDYEEGSKIAEFDFAPSKTKDLITRITVFDISDRREPVILKKYTVNGNYFESRMIDGQVYFIIKQPVYYSDNIVIPEVKEKGFRVSSPGVYYFDNAESNYVFHTIGSLNLNDDRSTILAKSFMLGYTNNVYFSKNNIYISYQKNFPYSYYEYLKVDRFFKIIVPLLPQNVQNDIAKVEDNLQLSSKESYIEAWDKISIILENMYNFMGESEKEELISKIENAVSNYESQIEEEKSQTIIHKIEISGGNVEYKTRGQIKGALLNQFSMDEKDGLLRVATTTQFYSREDGYITNNNVYVLNGELQKIGQIEKIAPNEQIYSTRFIDDRLYMVTYERVDPLFTIDLSNPENPEILGQLKVPGFSNYLHPYDENYLIGIGKDTNEDDRGNIVTKGVKLSLFDVSDIERPTQVDTITIGDSGSYSTVLDDHKAFLFDKDKNLLALPIREVNEKYEEDDEGYFRNKIWNGAYIFTITKNGFKERGKISHNEDEESNSYYWNSPFNVKRILFMDDNLYTVSDKYVKINDLGTVENIGSVKLPYEDTGYEYPILVDEGLVR